LASLLEDTWVSSEVSTDGDVEDDRLGSEKLAGVARGLWVKSRRCRPRARIRIGGVYVRGNLAAGEEPNLDSVIVPKRGVHSSTSTRESGTVRLRTIILDEATFVTVRLVEAVWGDERAGFLDWGACRRVHAPLKGVERVSIGSDHVHILDNVNFAIIGPIGALCPVGRPDRATERQMYGIHDHETARSQSVIGEYFNAVPAKCRVVGAAGGVIDLDDDIASAVDEGQVLLLSNLPCLVENISCCVGVDPTVERPAVKEGGSSVILHHLELLAQNHGSERK